MADAGLVYYVLDASRCSQRVKIGFTTNLSLRLQHLQEVGTLTGRADEVDLADPPEGCDGQVEPPKPAVSVGG